MVLDTFFIKILRIFDTGFVKLTAESNRKVFSAINIARAAERNKAIEFSLFWRCKKLKNLQWINDILAIRRDCLREPVVNTGGCTKKETLPEGCVAVIMELLAEGAAKKGCLTLQQRTEERMKAQFLPELFFDGEDDCAIADNLAEILEASGKLPLQEKSFVRESNCVTIGMAMYICAIAGRAVKTADIAVSMNLEAIRGELGAFDKRLQELGRPYPGQIESAENVRRITSGSKLTTSEGRYAFGYDKKPRVQDAICVRATPQTHGGVRDIFHWCAAQVVEDWNVHAHALYRTEYAMDALATALADLAHISERRSFRLCETRLSYGLPMNLVPDELGINYGFPIIQSTQAAETAELKLLTLPAAAIKRKNVSLAYYSASKLFELVRKLNRVMAVEILMSAQALDIVHAKIPGYPCGTGTAAAHQCLREKIPMMCENRFVAPDMIEAEKMTSDGVILNAVEAKIGTLK